MEPKGWLQCEKNSSQPKRHDVGKDVGIDMELCRWRLRCGFVGAFKCGFKSQMVPKCFLMKMGQLN